MLADGRNARASRAGFDRRRRVGARVVMRQPDRARPAARAGVRSPANAAVLRRVLAWGAIGALAAVLGVIGRPRWWATTPPGANGAFELGEVLVGVEVAALLLWRVPLLCFLAAEVALVIYGVRGYPSTPANYAGLVATGIAAWGCSGRLRYAPLVGGVCGTLVIGLARPGGAPWEAFLANLLLVVGAWCVGWGVHGQQEAHRARLVAAAEAEAVRLAEERLAMAEALHDRVGNAIAAATRQLETVEVLDAGQGMSVTRRANSRLRAALVEIAQLVGSWSAELPDGGRGDGSTDEAAPPEASATTSSGQVFARFQDGMLSMSSSGIELEARVGAGVVLDLLQDRLLADALDEALSNVLKHSDAPRVEVVLEQHDERLRLRVRDAGPPREAPVGSAGTGLARLERRFGALGGSLTARPDAAGGFELEAMLPKLGR